MSLTLNKLKIDCFRGVSGCELDNLGRFNLLVGMNNSGKTSVLEAINIYANPLSIAEWIGLARRREIKSSRVSLLDSLTWLFPNYGFDTSQKEFNPPPRHSQSIQISSQGKYEVDGLLAMYDPRTRIDVPSSGEPTYEQEYMGYIDTASEMASDLENESITVMGCEIYIKALSSLKQPTLFDSSQSFDTKFQIWENEKFQLSQKQAPVSLPVQFISPFSHRVEQLQIKALTDSTLSGFKEVVVKILQALDAQIKDIEILSKDGLSPSIYIKHLQTGMTPLSMFGDGIRKALTFALAIPAAANGILLLDEMETSLHTSALQSLFKWLLEVAMQYNVQIFATTHSLEAVDAILKASEVKTDSQTEASDLVVYHLERDKKSMKVKRLSDDLLYRLRFKRGLDIR